MDGIVVGVDTTAAGERALDWAVREAVSRGVPLSAVRAYMVPALALHHPTGGDAVELAPAVREEAERTAAEMLRAAAERAGISDRERLHSCAVAGVAGEVLVDAAEGAALLVVGSRGAGALSRAVLGSVSTTVLHHAHRPVVVVPESAVAAVTGRVVVGVDHSRGSLRALHVGIETARRYGSTLVPVFVHEAAEALPEDVTLSTLETSERRSLVDAARTAGADDLRVEPEVLTGQTAAELLATVRPDDLLVLGSRGHGGFLGLVLGSTSAQCATHAVCAVAVVPE